MFVTPIAQAGALAMAIVCILAVTIGRWPERVAGAALAICWVSSAALEDRRSWHHAQGAIFAIDVFYAALMITIALRTRRHWTLFAAAFALMIVVTHVALLVDRRVFQWEFFTAYYVWSYGVLIALAAGTLLEARRAPRLR